MHFAQTIGSMVAEGQCMYLGILKFLLQEEGDVDANFMDDLAAPLPLGVEEATLTTPGEPS